MKTILEKSRFIYGVPLTAIAVSAMLLMGSTTGANAWHYGRGHGPGVVGSGIIGGAIGGAVAGKKGILPGVVGGVIVNEALRSRPARAAPPPPPPPAPIYDSGLVYNIQLSLARLGYSPGPVDGVYGYRTAEAIRNFENNTRLPVTGQPSQGLYYHLQQAGG